MIKKGKVAKAVMSKTVTGPMDTAKPKGGEVKFGYAPAGRKGKKA